MLLVRSLTSADSLSDLTELIHRAYASLGEIGLNYTAVDQTVAVTSKRIAAGHCFVAEWANSIAGTIVVQPPYASSLSAHFRRSDVASAHQFCVEPTLQGRGIGRALLEAAESWAEAHDYRELAVDTAEPALHLVALYNKLGYRHVEFVQWPGKRYRSAVLSKRLHPVDKGRASGA